MVIHKLYKFTLKNLDKYVSFPEPLIVPNPQPADRLSSVLLSVPIAMGVYSFNSDDEALVPYQRLIELGSDGSEILDPTLTQIRNFKTIYL